MTIFLPSQTVPPVLQLITDHDHNLSWPEVALAAQLSSKLQAAPLTHASNYQVPLLLQTSASSFRTNK